MITSFDDAGRDFFRDSLEIGFLLTTAETSFFTTMRIPAKKPDDLSSNCPVEQMFWLEFHTHERF
jgi:hypothetical protein